MIYAAGGLINVYNEWVGYNRNRGLRMAEGIHVYSPCAGVRSILATNERPLRT